MTNNDISSNSINLNLFCWKMEQLKSELDKLLKALEKLEGNVEKNKIKNENKNDSNIELKKEFINIRGKVSNLIQDFENS